MSYLLDTNVVSELRKRDPNPYLLTWIDGLIAATANARGWTLVTRSTSDVQGAASLLNPFEPPA